MSSYRMANFMLRPSIAKTANGHPVMRLLTNPTALHSLSSNEAKCGAGCRLSGVSCSGVNIVLLLSGQILRPKLYPLRERQIPAEINRRRLPAHVGFPRVAAAFTAAAGGLLAAERTANFRTARSD